MNKKLYRDEFHQKIGGVCAGLSEYFETDVTLIRILFVVFAFTSIGIITYFAMWIILPRKGYMFNNFNNPTVDYRVPLQQPNDPADMPPPASRYGNNPFGNAPYTPPPFVNEPMPDIQRRPSHTGIIFGAVLIMIGGLVLINNYNLIPDIDFSDAWPVILVFIGAALIVSGQAQQAWHKTDWNKSDKSADANPSVTDHNAATSDHNPTIE